MKIPDSKCTGCLVCIDACAQKCISLKYDDEGFIRPKVDYNRCIHCGLCDRVCPVQHNISPKINDALFFAAKHKNKMVQINSSSGGVFSAISDVMIHNGGIIIGGVE